MIAASAIRHSSRQAMNSATRTRKMTRALTAFSVMLRPQVELTELTLTNSGSTFAAAASASLHLLALRHRLVADLDQQHARRMPMCAPAPWRRCRRCRGRRARRAWSTVRFAGRHLPGDATLEVEAEVEAVGDQRHDRDEQQQPRQSQTPPALAVEVDRGLAVVQPPAETSALVNVGQVGSVG